MPPIRPIEYHGAACYSFKQLDESRGVVKGTAFRAFKAASDALVEGVDFFYLDADQERSFIDALRAQNLIYRASRHVVLLTDSGRQRLVGWS